jgi:hypothetical protein
MFDPIFIILVALFVKHWYIDFVNQSPEEVQYKGVYADWRGVRHSLKHGIATMFLLWIFVPLETAYFIGLVEFLVHYHTDYVKMRFGNRDIQTPQFWAQLGLDQLVHSLNYVWIVWYIL